MRLSVVGLVVLAAACGGKKEADKEASGAGTGSALASGHGTGTGAVAAVVIDAAPAPPPDAAPLVDLPPLVIGELDEATIKKSINLNNAGYAAHKKQDWATAEAKYTEAVRADPGNTRARFNLACVYSSSDQADKAFFVLGQFKQPNCRACDAVLLKAKVDREWKARLDDPRFVALQEGITGEPTDTEKVTRMLIKALKTGKTDGMEPYIHPRNPIKVTELVWGPDQPKPEYIYGWTGFVKEVGKGNKELDLLDIECNRDGSCCTSAPGERGDSTDTVDDVCFEGGGDVLFVSSFTYDFGPI